MTVLKFIHYALRAKQVRNVHSLLNIYDQQCMRDLKDTLHHMQVVQDKIHPGSGFGVAIAANQLQYPYQHTSATDPSPALGFYPQDYAPPNIYLVNIRPERARLSHCDTCEPTFFINAVMDPLDDPDESKSYSGEACPSLDGFHGLNVPRYHRIAVYAYNESGEWQRHEYAGFVARVHQHEIDFGRNIEYLLRLSFSVQELQQINRWLSAPVLGHNWIVPGKLECASLTPDLIALQEWVSGHAHLYARVIIISANHSLGLALTRYYLSKGHEVIATYKSIDDAHVFKPYQKQYPDQLGLKVLDLDNHEHIENFVRHTAIYRYDLILYLPSDKMSEKSGISAYFEQFRLISALFTHLLKKHVFWVDINMGNTMSLLTQGLIENLDTTLQLEWEQKKGKTGLSKRPCAISVQIELKHVALEISNIDHIAEGIVTNCINPIRQSKVSAVYRIDGTRASTQETSQKELMAEQEKSNKIIVHTHAKEPNRIFSHGLVPGRSEKRSANVSDPERRHSY